MPPVSRQRRPLSYEDPSLSDEDVGLLFQVITRAERSPEVDRLPFRVLFQAYDEVIAEHGVDADPGYACMRFLLKMGKKNIVGDSLFDKFENLLEQNGIVIEFGGENDDDNDEENETYEDSAPVVDGRLRARVDRDSTPREDTTQIIRRRRASFNSMYDVGDDPTQRSLLNRPSSRSSLSRLPMEKPDFTDLRPSPPRNATTRKAANSPDRTQLIAQFIDVGRRLMSRMDLLDPEKNQKVASNGVEARSAVDEDRSKRIAEASQSRRRQRSPSSKASDEDVEESSASDDPSETVDRPEVPLELLYRPSLSDLLRDASTFNMYRQRAINRRILTQWLKKAIQTRQSHQNMEVVAVNRDRLTLVRQAFDTWHTIIQKKQQAERTEKFFKRLEERAGRARDLYLMTKAFTHWAQVSSEEIARTSAARQHVLGVKYFNAWREITAVNELKAQRFALRRPFNAWKKKLHQVREAEEKAVVRCNEQATHNVYWQWFWCFCERRAPQWYDNCLKRRSLLYWLRKFRNNRERIHEIDLNNKHNALNLAWQAWTERSKAVAAGQQEAVSRERRQLLEVSIGEWRIQSQLAPAASQVAAMVDNRIVKTAFGHWVKRAQMVSQARELNRQRIVRNSWTSWNDLLRCQALSARIEERLKMETMYKWILAERYRLMQRIREQRITRDVFSTFVTNVRSTYSRLLDNAERHEEKRNKELLRSKFTLWRGQLSLQHQRDVVAFEFYAPRLAEESLVAWRSKLDSVAKLDAWARDAQYYFGTTRTMKKWRKATVEAAKRRRQDAYSQTRRMIKINLASRVLGSWSIQAQHVSDLEQQALQFSRRKSLTLASGFLDQWHEKAQRQIQDAINADTYFFRRIAYNQLIRLAEVLIEWHRLGEQADSVYHLHVLGQANVHLRRLSLRVFQIKSSAETAGAMRERSLRRHSRGMFRNWLEKTRMNIEARDSPGPLMSPAKTYDGASRADQAIFDPWYPSETPFKLGDFVGGSPAPSPNPLATPNFMSSPSKRAARARVLAQVSTTPATPLQTPFASRLLRARTGSLPKTASSKRPRNGRASSLGTSVRFVDEEPESPTDGRRSSGRRM
ncbi:putative centrin-binding protein Sfi1 [Aspergillus steynii IBT 23096]|uniref:Putative centrin-binding protein Sfi1 n=1 Tax=Aspergillus steynii IBT 23096 TaxID=1392250 RepID=A0A2I2GHB6_9EURO|nr:putative centrin-binding protein Sfi1 [Aspergillus steynii IBT 23096]PLB52266.1 putative centrin-binding protein Sfi1 [Aspergillus steynii IBT 23096]